MQFNPMADKGKCQQTLWHFKCLNSQMGSAARVVGKAASASRGDGWQGQVGGAGVGAALMGSAGSVGDGPGVRSPCSKNFENIL